MEKGLVRMHDNDGREEAQDVGSQGGVEVGRSKCASHREAPPSMSIVTEKKGNENARNDNVAQPEHAELKGPRAEPEILGEEQFDGGIKVLGHCHHHFSEKDPPDVVEEEAALGGGRESGGRNEGYEEDGANGEGAKVEHGHSLNRETKTQHIVGQPRLAAHIPGR